MDWVLPALGGLGIGAILKLIIDFYLSKNTNRQKLKYEEMKDSYIGLLDALHQAAIEPSDKNSKNFALWQTRVNLFGTENVSKAVQGIIDTNDGPREERNLYFNELLRAMKNDLDKGSA
jgi:hypothetical protein